jgi:hypothetical protein
MVTKQVEERLVTIDTNTPIEHGGSGRVERLYKCTDWDKAMFRWPNPIHEWRESRAIACNIEITGRTFQRRKGDYWVKIRITWVGDGEPDQYSDGWAMVNPWNCPTVTPEE